jgi:short-subunit dehydrogenase
MEVNAMGTINMAATLLECMAGRGQGHIVLISSIAGLYPLSGSPTYSASKAAVSYYGQALRPVARSKGVRVSVVYPGYVQSPMSKRLIGPQPMRWSAPKAAAHIVERLNAGSDSIAFPFLLALGARTLHLLPTPVADFFVKYFSFTVEPDRESPLAKS